MVQLSILAGVAFASLVTALPAPLKIEATKDGLCISRDVLEAILQGKLPMPGGNPGQPSNPPGGGMGNMSKGMAKALYFITNADKNEIVALKVGQDGKLSDGSRTATGGAGQLGLNATGQSALPDPLFSQGSLTVAGDSLFAVNAGSNTLTMFNIDPRDRTKLTMVGKPISTLGEFPMSVTASDKLKIACVANSGAKSGVACFSVNKAIGLSPLDKALRPMPLGQTTPPKGPTNTISHIFFNSDASALMTTVKGDPPTNKTGFLSVFPVANGQVSAQETRSSPAGTVVLFGSAPIPGSKDIFVTDAAFGSATLAIGANNQATVKAKTEVPDQRATCWATISDMTKTAFVTDVARNRLVEVDVQTGAIVATLNSANGNPGLIDLVTAGNFVYTLAPGNATVKTAVTVFDISGGRGSAKEFQNFQVPGVTNTVQGLAFI